MTESKHFLGANARTWWTLVIAVAVASLAAGISAWIAVDHANANDRRQQELSNQQFRHAMISSNTKFQQALRISNAQSAYAQNKAACGWRAFTAPVLKSYQDAAKDPTLSDSARARNDKRIKTTQEFLESQITVPPSFDCTKLPKRPPK